ncbi:hypothetical protein EAF00_002499 [Botryotinia globosa]|nr:hypothetical protein EAF00_002499 [Botryotinia globosa]
MEEEKVQKLPPRIIQHMTEFDTTYHPGVDPKDLVHVVHDTIIGDGDLKFDDFEFPRGHGQIILCYNCGLDDQDASSGYTSRVKISYIKHNNAMWELGGPDGPWILRDEINTAKNPWSVDYTVQKFLRDANLGLPLVEMYRFGGGDGRFNYTMMSRAKGKTLMELEEDLCDEQNADLDMDLKKHIKTIRQFTSPHMRRVDGGELHDNYIGNCYGFPCVKTGRNEEEWLENLTPAMRKGLLWTCWRKNKAGLYNPTIRDAWIKSTDEHIAKIKAGFPKGGPYVLTHGDLSGANLFASNDNADQKWKITAIIDWETAGYFPWWVELARNPFLLGGPGTTEENILGFCPPTFNKEDWEPMMKAIKSVSTLWSSGGTVGRSSHGKGGANKWYSKEFCECHKSKKQFLEWDMGWPQEHHDAFDPEISDPDDDPEIENFNYDFDKDEREFLRWFKTIST